MISKDLFIRYKIIYIYKIIQTEQTLCHFLPHFIRTNVSYDDVDWSQHTNKIAYAPITKTTTIY
jgi:hypothetical protein